MSAHADTFVDTLVGRLEADPQVIGLVLAGSSAETSRRDEWSDHDFLVIVVDGVAEQYRTNLSWLPDHDQLAFSFRETAHGLKALYRDGLMLEFAIFTRDEFAGCALNHYRVAVDGDGIGALAAQIQQRSLSPSTVDRAQEFRNFVALVYIGTGRARRGERLSANSMIRQWAMSHLLVLLRDLMPSERAVALDALDPWRRFESVDPGLAADIDAALAQPIDLVGRALLAVADRELSARWAEYPRDELVAVVGLLGG